MYVLDTNACIGAIRQHGPTLARLTRRSPDELAIASMTLGELWFGALKSTDPARGRAIVDEFVAPFHILPFDEDAAEAYSGVRRHLESKGTPIGERDLIIAATALANGFTVVTNNTRELGRVPGLEVEDWSS
jgi:tRNA(fMet)-specific endonuclease VapC